MNMYDRHEYPMVSHGQKIAPARNAFSVNV